MRLGDSRAAANARINKTFFWVKSWKKRRKTFPITAKLNSTFLHHKTIFFRQSGSLINCYRIKFHFRDSLGKRQAIKDSIEKELKTFIFSHKFWNPLTRFSSFKQSKFMSWR